MNTALAVLTPLKEQEPSPRLLNHLGLTSLLLGVHVDHVPRPWQSLWESPWRLLSARRAPFISASIPSTTPNGHPGASDVFCELDRVSSPVGTLVLVLTWEFCKNWNKVWTQPPLGEVLPDAHRHVLPEDAVCPRPLCVVCVGRPPSLWAGARSLDLLRGTGCWPCVCVLTLPRSIEHTRRPWIWRKGASSPEKVTLPGKGAGVRAFCDQQLMVPTDGVPSHVPLVSVYVRGVT